MRTLALISLGSNLGEPVRRVREAAARLKRFSASPIDRSSLWESTPVDCPPGSANFVNAIIALQPFDTETPESLLEKLHALEREAERLDKRVLNEPRTLDLDLIAFGRETRATPALILPHPRAHERRFVLQPLSEIAPRLKLPGQTRTVAELLSSLKTGEVLRRLGPL